MKATNYHILARHQEEQVITCVIDKFRDIVLQSIQDRGRCTVALSGGKTPQRLYERLRLEINPDLWSKIYIFSVDERCVPIQNSESNTAMIQKFFQPVPQVNMCLVEVHSSQPEFVATQYEQRLKSFFGALEYPRFDIILLGIGDDGHTASLFPEDTAPLGGDQWVQAIHRAQEAYGRVSLTFLVLNHAQHVFFLVLGLSKAKIVAEVVKGTKKHPATLVKPEQGQVHLFLDHASASGLIPNYGS